MTITEFLPSTEELETGMTKPQHPTPSLTEQRLFVQKIALELGFCDPVQTAWNALPRARWDAARGTLTIDGRPIQAWLRNLAKAKPELAWPDGGARIEATVNAAHQRSDASLLTTVKAQKRFIARYGITRFQEIQHHSETQ